MIREHPKDQPDPADTAAAVQTVVWELLSRPSQPSAWDLVHAVEERIAPKARWHLLAVLEEMATTVPVYASLSPGLSNGLALTRAQREYVRSLLESGDLEAALNGAKAPRHQVESTIDLLVQSARRYRTSAAFIEMLDFMARFRDYAPFNNMLVRLQDPTCSFFATARDWKRRFDREVKEDARPMLILAPMHPVMVVYGLDQTDGPLLPTELERFARFEGAWEEQWLHRSVENAARDGIRIQFKNLSSTQAGFAEVRFGHEPASRVRVVVHDGLNAPSRFGVLCHELAHIYLGHLGANEDGWWPGRASLRHASVEFEAEAAAYVVTCRLGLSSASAAYVSRYAADGTVPDGVSLDQIAKVSGRLEQMAKQVMPARPKKKPRRERERDLGR